MRLSVTEAAVAARCQRQFVLAREGLRVNTGGGTSIGQPAHAILTSFVNRGATHPLVAEELTREPTNEGALLHAVLLAFHRELCERAAVLLADLTVADFIRLARAVVDCAALAGELLVRARRAGLRGRACFDAALLESEKPISLDFDGLSIDGTLDLLCRDLDSGELFVFDLKTGTADAASDQQARLYARALKATPALACVSDAGFELRRVSEGDLDADLRSLRAVLDGSAAPAAAEAAVCAGCPVQKPCWSRWGRTLAEPVASSTSRLADEARRLEQTLRAHRVHLEPIDPSLAQQGPNLNRFRLSLREGEGISRVERCARDVQRSMGWPVPPLISNDGRHVALDAPRSDRERIDWSTLRLSELSGLEVPVGVTLTRELLKLDLAAAPHLLVAGTTGSGKTVFLKGLILSLLNRLPRSECQVAIVDPKMLDFPPFDRLPLWKPVITEPSQAVALLESLAEEELPRRTLLLRKAGATQRSDLPPGTLPALVVVIDEFADLTLSLGDRATKSQFLERVQRLLQRARAVGIHLVIATQRPSVDAIPGQLKANLPVRIAFKLATVVDSNTVLDEQGAESLLGAGDVLLKRDGQTIRAQAFRVEARDIRMAAGEDREAN
ncbi:MAG: PD-(D/E)XK nuclease family protein [Deltaproteobacteria bacterium]|nr:PD-(D/E)XK nuclease family protein [Deltaproteobacteria bacterium]